MSKLAGMQREGVQRGVAVRVKEQEVGDASSARTSQGKSDSRSHRLEEQASAQVAE